MRTLQMETQGQDAAVREAIAAAISSDDTRILTNEPGMLIVETGSVGMAYAAGPFRAAEKMPMRIQVTTAGSAAGTSITIQVAGRGTGGGFGSGGLLGRRKQQTAEEMWIQKLQAAAQGIGPSPKAMGSPPQEPGQFST